MEVALMPFGPLLPRLTKSAIHAARKGNVTA
jgi:hypothetical protein